jgi:hypothetical protein
MQQCVRRGYQGMRRLVWTSVDTPMRQVVLKFVIAASLVALGWTAGWAAQAPQADFEIHVDAPEGETTITCRRGCGLQFIRYAPDKDAAEPSFYMRCGGAPRCRATVQGWVLP